jgi:hypothetical protein
MGWWLGLGLLLALGGCATYYDEQWTDITGQNRDKFAQWSDMTECDPRYIARDEFLRFTERMAVEQIACMRQRGWNRTVTVRHASLFSRS